MHGPPLPGALIARLQAKGYSQIAGASPIALAMFKPASGLSVPKLLGVVGNTDTPSVSFSRVEPWFLKSMGRAGAGLLLLTVGNPSRGYVDEALGLGSGMLGYGQVVCGVYDLASGSCHLPKGAFDTHHMGWDQELFA
jgi:hypothetical protein